MKLKKYNFITPDYSENNLVFNHNLNGSLVEENTNDILDSVIEYFGKDDSGKKFVTTAKPLTNTFELNKQPSGVSRDDKKVNTAKNWLYYDLQEGDEGYNDKDSNNQDIVDEYNQVSYYMANNKINRKD